MKTTTKAGIAGALVLALTGALWMALGPGSPVDSTAPQTDVSAGDEKNFAPARVTVAPEGPAPVVAPVEGSAVVRGTVWFADRSGPAEGVPVRVGSGADTRSTVTDAAGHFVVPDLPPGFRGVARVDDRHHAPVVRPILPLRAGEDVDLGLLWLDLPCGATVRVLGLDGAPVPGAQVDARRIPIQPFTDMRLLTARRRDAVDPAETVATDDDGRARFETLEPTRWAFVVRRAGSARVLVGPVTLAGGTRRDDLVAYLAPGHRLVGRAHDRAGRGVAGLRVWADGGWATHSRPEALLPSAITDADGRFALGGLPDGDHTVSVAREGHPPTQAGRVRLPQTGEFDVLVESRVVTGSVRSIVDNRPIAGATVRVFSSHVSAEATTRDDGRYRLEIPLPLVIVSTPSASKTGFTATPGPEPVPWDPRAVDPGLFFGQAAEVTHDLYLRPAATLRGRVFSGDAGAPGARVLVMTRHRRTLSAVTDASGAYSIDAVAEGDVIVTVTDGPHRGGPQLEISDYTTWNDGGTVAGAIAIPPEGEVVHDVELLAAAGVVVEGRVLGPDGDPLVGASVGVWGNDTVTDADGKYVLETSLFQGKTYVTATGVGCLSESRWELCPEGAPRVTVDFRLVAARTVSGLVEGLGGAPPAGTWVQVSSAAAVKRLGQNGTGWMLVPKWPVAEDGSFAVELSVAAEQVVVRAGAAGLASDIVVADVDDDIRVRLGTLATIRGRAVLDESGEPAVGAQVLLDVPERHGWSWPVGRPTVDLVAAVTGANGRFEIADVVAGAHSVEVVQDGRLAARATIEDPQRELELRLVAMQTISGRVTFADGTPLVRGSVGVRFQGDDANGWRTIGTAVTLEDGSFTIGYLPEGDYDMSVTVGMSYSGIARVVREGVSAGATGVDVIVARAEELRGRVVDASGAPVGSASITALPDGPQRVGSGSTRPDGTFEISGLGAGVYTLLVRPPAGMLFGDIGATLGRRLLPVRRPGFSVPSPQPVLIELADGLTIEGTVQGASGELPEGSFVRADPVAIDDDTERPSWRRPPAAEIGRDGAFRVAGLAPGTYRLIAVHASTGRDGRPLIGGERVRAGARSVRTTVGDFATIEGVVVDASGKPLAEAFVRVIDDDGAERTAQTGADGSFTVSSIERGRRYVVHAWIAGRAPSHEDDVEADARGLHLAILAGERASGHLRTATGEPVADTSIVLRSAATPISVTAKTDAAGAFTVSGLLTGVTYEASYFGRRGGRSGTWPCGAVEAGSSDTELRTGAD